MVPLFTDGGADGASTVGLAPHQLHLSNSSVLIGNLHVTRVRVDAGNGESRAAPASQKKVSQLLSGRTLVNVPIFTIVDSLRYDRPARPLRPPQSSEQMECAVGREKGPPHARFSTRLMTVDTRIVHKQDQGGGFQSKVFILFRIFLLFEQRYKRVTEGRGTGRYEVGEQKKSSSAGALSTRGGKEEGYMRHRIRLS